MVKERPFLGQAVEGGRLDHGITVGSRMGPSPIIGEGKENVGSFVHLGDHGGRDQSEKRVDNRFQDTDVGIHKLGLFVILKGGLFFKGIFTPDATTYYRPKQNRDGGA